METVRIALIGCGYWGPNVVRAASALPGADISALVDSDLERAEALRRRYPGAVVASSLEDALEQTALDAAVIATPAASHFHLTEQALAHGLHVLVEKPLALSVGECLSLGSLGRSTGKVVMVGHTFRFSPPVEYVKQLIDRGELGETYYIDSRRLNLGRVRQDVDAIWNFAPHDVSIVNHWLGRMPQAVRCVGHEYLQKEIPDVGFLTLEYGDGVSAHIHVSWLSPLKVRQMTIVGSRQMVVYDDVANEKIVIHDAGIDREHAKTSFPRFQSFGEFQLIQRQGDLHVPRLAMTEPLVAQCAHFLECIVEGREPVAGAEDGAAVVAILEAATASRLAGGEAVAVERPALDHA